MSVSLQKKRISFNKKVCFELTKINPAITITSDVTLKDLRDFLRRGIVSTGRLCISLINQNLVNFANSLVQHVNALTQNVWRKRCYSVSPTKFCPILLVHTTTVHVTDLDKLDLVKIGNGGKGLGSS